MKSKLIKLHFVCRGNMHRSRLAEAYMKSLALPGFAVTSSGVEAEQYAPHAKMPFANLSIARHPELKPEVSLERVQTTEAILGAQDVVVCMDKTVFDDAVRWFRLDARKTTVWNIRDILTHDGHPRVTLQTRTALKALEESIFQSIRRECDELASYLTKTSWTGIVDQNDAPVGLRLPIAWANDRGLWHRGCHVVIATADGKIVAEKRSKDIVFAPGLLDISLGGSVDAGETPLQAAVRETREELGLDVPENHFKPLFVHRWSSYHPRYKKHTKAYIYTYFVQLPVAAPEFTLQASEVESILLLDRQSVRLLLAKHYLHHAGRLASGYAYYARAVRFSLREMRRKPRTGKKMLVDVK